MPDLKIIAAVALLAVFGPALMFPDLLPAAWQVPMVTAVTLVAVALAAVMVLPWTRLRTGLWLFLLALAASWAECATSPASASAYW